MRQYVALIHKTPYGVYFPDLPGCISAGATLDEARALAEEALAFHVKGMTEDGDDLPEPSSLETVMAERQNRDGVAILVQLKTEAVRAIRVNVTMRTCWTGSIDMRPSTA